MSDLSPETLALLDRARDGEALPAADRSAMRRRLAVAVGVAAPLAMGSTAAASVSAAAWVARGLAVLGTVGAVSAAVVVPSLRTPNPPPSAMVAPVRAATPAVVARPPAPAVSPAPPTPPAPPAPEPAQPPAPLATPVLSLVPAPSPVARRAAHATPPAPAAAIDPVAPATRAEPLEDTLAAEVRLVNGARAAIDGRDPARALDLLADHQRRFAAGALEPEASALRVDALCAAGRTPEAEAEALRFHSRHPGSPLERRLAATCARGALR